MKVVSFDIWGTLLDLTKFYSILSRKVSLLCGKRYEEVFELILTTYRKALAVRLGGGFSRVVIESAEFFSRELKITVEQLFQALAMSVDEPEISELAYLDAAEALEAVRASGYATVALGNVMFWPGMVTRYFLYKNGLLKYFDLTVFSDEVGIQKPSREVFEYVARKLGVSVGEIVHVGDSPENDLAGALIAGARAVLIKRDSPIGVVRLGASAYLINDLRKLVEVLRELGEAS